MIDFALILDSLPSLLLATCKSLLLAAGAFAMGLVGSTCIAITQNPLTKAFVTLIRGTPLLLQLLFYFYVFSLAPWQAALLALGLNSSVYLSEAIKVGIKAVSIIELEAAKALGFSSRHRFLYILFPQTWRAMLPAMGNEVSTLIKDSSLASAVGVVELTKMGAMIRGKSYDALTVFFIVGLLYLMMTTFFNFLLKRLEKCSLSTIS